MRAPAFGAATLVPGAASGPVLRLDEPLSFWGGLDSATGRIIDRLHPQRGATVAGRVLMMPGGRGSSSGSATLAEALRLGKGPAAILMLERDAIVVVGAMVAAELYGLACPVALKRDLLWRNREGFPKRRESDSTYWLLIGGQRGWGEPILWTCGSG
jgi:predicted aconitase with swiveling domain